MKGLYSYESCLQFSFHLIKRYQIDLSVQQISLIESEVIKICSSSLSFFWANYRNKLLSVAEYKSITRKIVSYLLRKVPVPYLKKTTSFSNLSFLVRRGVLVPQPTTEVLINCCQQIIDRLWEKNSKMRILDIGTGSGNVAICLATLNHHSKIFSVDINRKALAVARKNVSLHNLKNVKLIESNLFSELSSYSFDVIISNPPYIDKSEYQFLSPYVKSQPKRSLISMNRGYYFYQRIIKDSKRFLRDRFLLIFEIGLNQSSFVVKLLRQEFPKNKIEVFNDFSGVERVIALYAS